MNRPFKNTKTPHGHICWPKKKKRGVLLVLLHKAQWWDVCVAVWQRLNYMGIRASTRNSRRTITHWNICISVTEELRKTIEYQGWYLLKKTWWQNDPVSVTVAAAWPGVSHYSRHSHRLSWWSLWVLLLMGYDEFEWLMIGSRVSAHVMQIFMSSRSTWACEPMLW